MTCGSSMLAMSFTAAPQCSQGLIWIAKTRLRRCAQLIAMSRHTTLPCCSRSTAPALAARYESQEHPAPRCHRSRETRWAKSRKKVSPQARNASPNSSDATLHPRSPRIVVATDRSLFSTAAAPTRVVSVRRLSVSQSEINPIPFPLCHPQGCAGSRVALKPVTPLVTSVTNCRNGHSGCQF